MSSIVTSILSSIMELLLNKVRDATAKKLKDDDLTEAKRREIVVTELNDIQTKFKGFPRNALLKSYIFLQEGVQLLNLSLKSKEQQKAVQSKTQDDRGETSRMPSGDESVLNEAIELSHVMGKLKIASSDSERNHFKSAQKRFQRAREEATEAFCNEALNIQDRIFAAKLRVVSEILECLDNPATAVTSCLWFLENLHDLLAVREIFSVYLGGGLKSFFNKTERVENVKSVMMINCVLYQFVSKFSSKYCSALAWPTVELSARSFYPIFSWQEVSTILSWGEELIQPPNEMKLDRHIFPYNSAVNSRGEIVVWDDNDIEVVYRTGEIKVAYQFSIPSTEDKEEEVIKQEIVGLALDQENNVYVVLNRETTSQNDNVDSHAVLYVLNEHCNHVKQKRVLDFLPKHKTDLRLAIDKDNNILVTSTTPEDRHIYVCDHIGQFKYQFEHEMSALSCTSVSENNEIMLVSFRDDAVEIYTEEGNLKLKLHLPAGHGVCGMTFHFVIRKTIVLSKVIGSDSYFLNCYSETGQLETSMLCFNYSEGFPEIKSHPSGPVAIVRERNITYI